MSTLEDSIYQELTNGYEKNDINWYHAMDRARERLNRLDNEEFLELLSRHLEDRLSSKENIK